MPAQKPASIITESFTDELTKTALLQALKNLALKEVPHTPPGLLGAARPAAPLSKAEQGFARYGKWQKEQAAKAPAASGVFRTAPKVQKPPASATFRIKFEKDGDALPDGITYNPGDFMPVNILKKRANAMTPAGRLAHSSGVGQHKTTAPPGPSIADIAKPRGKGFGTGTAGSFKTGIGGTAGTTFQ